MSTYQLSVIIEKGNYEQLQQAAQAATSRAVRESLLALARERQAKAK